MPFSYVDTPEAISADGLRMVVVGDVPSPWVEAAKGMFHVKGITWKAVRLDHQDPAQAGWSGGQSAPIAVLDDEAPVDDARGLIALAERLAPEPCLLPNEFSANILALVDRLAGQGGLGWQRRIHMVDLGLRGQGGFHPKIAAYLGAKYGHSEDAANKAEQEVVKILGEFSALLEDGRTYLVGDQFTVADIYLACFVALFAPLPEEKCAMKPTTRAVFETLPKETHAALRPVLLEHRDRIYAEWLELPLSL